MKKILTKNNKRSQNYEVRSARTVFRAQEDDSISGLAAVFDSPSNDLGGFVEVIERGAFDMTEMHDVVALFNHDRNQVLGRFGGQSNTLSLDVVDEGLEYRIAPPVTQLGRDIVALVKRGDINKSSFGFDLLPDGSDWVYDTEGRVTHKISSVARLWDVSPVTFPAYAATHVREALLEEAEAFMQKALKEKEGSQHRLDAIAEAYRKRQAVIRKHVLEQHELVLQG